MGEYGYCARCLQKLSRVSVSLGDIHAQFVAFLSVISRAGQMSCLDGESTTQYSSLPGDVFCLHAESSRSVCAGERHAYLSTSSTSRARSEHSKVNWDAEHQVTLGPLDPQEIRLKAASKIRKFFSSIAFCLDCFGFA